MGMNEILERRKEAHAKIIQALADLPRERAMGVLLSRFSIDELEQLIARFTEEAK